MKGSTQYGDVLVAAVGFVFCFTVSSAADPVREGLSARSLYYRESAKLPASKAAINKPTHLGVRYNLIAVDPGTAQVTAADETRTFRRGECIALDIEANERAYLYVLERGSSGAWQALLPSAELRDQENVLESGVPVRVPRKNCLKIVGPAGTERIFLVLSRIPINGEVARLRPELLSQTVEMERTSGSGPVAELPRSTFVVAGDQTGRIVAEIALRHD